LKAYDKIPRYDLFGVSMSAITYEQAAELIVASAQQRVGAVITHLPVHGLVLASRDAMLREKINSFDIVAPDGQPVRWALNYLYGTGLSDRVYGPEFMMRLCQKAASLGIGIYLYGSYPHVVESLRANLLTKFPDLKVVGYESPPFRPLTPEEDQEAVDRINCSGAGILFLGLGCPLQDTFAYEHRQKIKAAQICVGAAFDLHAENKKMAPRWMQKRGLEWLYRLLQDPRRLWWRYLSTNSMFLLLFLKTCLSNRVRLTPSRV
jgi:N-acetylglucosaminyldiphosphoundecaprenol N-acetyl-beta-D-mannosaminyltransferase